MGCWGVTAFESDSGLDAVGFVRRHLPESGKLELSEVIEALRKDDWIPDVQDGRSHTSLMAVAEVMMKYLDHDVGSMDYDEEWARDDNKFRSITSFTASKDALQQLRGYLSDTLYYARTNAELSTDTFGGWFEEKNWIGWQDHMKELLHRLDQLLILPESAVDLLSPPPLDAVQKSGSDILGITQDTFIREMRLQFDCSEKAASLWLEFARECVEYGQYVDLDRVTNDAVERSRWMEATLKGLLDVQSIQGEDAAKKVCELAAESQCLYPFEMQAAAKCLQNGGTLEDILAMIESGEIENTEEFSPRMGGVV